MKNIKDISIEDAADIFLDVSETTRQAANILIKVNACKKIILEIIHLPKEKLSSAFHKLQGKAAYVNQSVVKLVTEKTSNITQAVITGKKTGMAKAQELAKEILSKMKKIIKSVASKDKVFADIVRKFKGGFVKFVTKVSAHIVNFVMFLKKKIDIKSLNIKSNVSGSEVDLHIKADKAVLECSLKSSTSGKGLVKSLKIKKDSKKKAHESSNPTLADISESQLLLR